MAEASVGEVLERPKEIRNFTGEASLVLPHDFIGIEIELEGLTKIPELPSFSYWALHADNSLRTEGGENPLQAIEFVLKFPLCGKDLVNSLKEFHSTVGAMKKPPITSERTSVHIHLDVRDLSIRELYRLIIIYCVFEKVLFRYCGIDREDNNFCVPFYRAEGHIFENISEIQRKGLRQFTKYLESEYRYAALNLCALLKFGSVEFRHCGGTYDVESIKNWINIIFKLKQYAKNTTFSLQTFPSHISDLGYLPIIEEVFGEYAPLLVKIESKQDLLIGIRQAQKILCAATSQEVEQRLNKELWGEQTVEDSPLIKKYLQKKGIYQEKKKNDNKQNNNATYSVEYSEIMEAAVAQSAWVTSTTSPSRRT